MLTFKKKNITFPWPFSFDCTPEITGRMFVKVPSLHVFSILTFMLRFQSFTFAKFEDCLRILLAEFKWGPTVLRMKGNLLQQV